MSFVLGAVHNLFLMRELILRLAGSDTLRKTVKYFRLHLLANWWLHCFPVVKSLPASGIRYRARRVESLGLSVEMFDKSELYSISDSPGTSARLPILDAMWATLPAGYVTG